MRPENKAALAFVVLGLLCWPAASRIWLQDGIDASRDEAESQSSRTETLKNRLAKLGPSPASELDKMKIEELYKLRGQARPADAKRAGILTAEIDRREFLSQLVKAHQGEIAARVRLTKQEALARPLNAALALVTVGMALAFWALMMLVWGSLRTAAGSDQRRRLWIYLMPLTASLPGAFITLAWWLGRSRLWQGRGEDADYLMISGLAAALAGLFIPARTRRAEDPSWSLAKTPLARGPRLALWGLLRLFFLVHGSNAVHAEGEAARLDGPALRRHALIAAGLAAGALSVLGLLIGNIGRILAVFGAYGIVVPALLLLLAAALRLRNPALRRAPRWPCPHCKAEMKAADILFGFAGAFEGLRRCPSCSGATTPLGAAAGPTLPAAGALLKPWLRAAAATWVCALAGFIAAGYAWNAAGSVRLAQAREQVRRAGYSTELPHQRPAPPDGENAVKLYEKAGQAISDAKSDLRFFKNQSEDVFARAFLVNAARGAVSREETAAARLLVDKYRDMLILLEQGAARPQEHWDVDWDHRPSYEIKVPKYSGLIRLERILACRAALAAADGKAEAAAKDLRLGLTLARSVELEPMLISLMVAAAMSNIMLDAAPPVMRGASLTQARAQFSPLLSADRLIAGFRRSMAIEHYGFTGWVAERGWADLWRAHPNGEYEPGGFWLYWPFLKFDLASYHRGALDLDAALALPFPASKTAWDKAFERFQRTAWLQGQTAMPRFEQLSEKVLVAQARQRLALASFAVRAFQEKEKRWPDGLWEVGPITDKDLSLQDPFTGGPFKILRRQGGLLIYSVGPDGVDDQGAPYDNDSMTGDLAWRL